MRLFVAVRPSEQALAHLRAVFRGGAYAPGRWHVTLGFLAGPLSPG